MNEYVQLSVVLEPGEGKVAGTDDAQTVFVGFFRVSKEIGLGMKFFLGVNADLQLAVIEPVPNLGQQLLVFRGERWYRQSLPYSHAGLFSDALLFLRALQTADDTLHPVRMKFTLHQGINGFLVGLVAYEQADVADTVKMFLDFPETADEEITDRKLDRLRLAEDFRYVAGKTFFSVIDNVGHGAMNESSLTT